MTKIRRQIEITGIVQGVGFRPFIHRLTSQHGLTGWIYNTSRGVQLELQGEEEELDVCIEEIPQKAPAIAAIERLSVSELPCIEGETEFQIRSSEKEKENNVLISPDVAICEDCRRELLTPGDRRYRYPFINCTNCGPRFTIIQDVPYDRGRTVMAPFLMCRTCQSEYEDIENRRYHAQPDCCAECGPEIFYVSREEAVSLLSRLSEGASDEVVYRRAVSQKTGALLMKPGEAGETSIARAQELLIRGEILAVKGLGGMHLACRADRPALIHELRARKRRDEKSFALMCRDLEMAERIAYLSAEEKRCLLSPARPIVLCRKREGLCEGISENSYVGIMLPYTPLHVLLMEREELGILVMTSANRSDCPIMYRNAEALFELRDIADGFLLHNREIETRCDDSLLFLLEGKRYFFRRSRGYVPFPVTVSQGEEEILACGAEQKASFALAKGDSCFPAQHIGDLKNMETYAYYVSQISHFERMFGIRVRVLVCDRHPDYMSTNYAEERAREESLPLIRVWHHHAHMASCMADNGVFRTVIGLVWDGTGYGPDGTIWGGEVLLGDAVSFQRLGSIRPICLVGGDRAVREIYRIAYSLMRDAGFSPEECTGFLRDNREPDEEDGEVVKEASLRVLEKMIISGRNCPISTGMGRLFDGICAIIGRRYVASYEGQGAVLLEAMAGESERSYPLEWEEREGALFWDTRAMIRQLVRERQEGGDVHEMAAAFMNTLVAMAVRQCIRIWQKTGVSEVVLSGGVFQNRYILERLLRELRQAGLTPYRHQRVSTNDEGIALGQLLIARSQRELRAGCQRT